VTETQQKILMSLQGGARDLQGLDLGPAYELHRQGLVFMASGTWPTMSCHITFAGRKALSKTLKGSLL